MTLRARLLTVTIAMVAMVVIVLAGLNLNSLVGARVDASADRAEDAARQVQASILRGIERNIPMPLQPTPVEPMNIAAVKAQWTQAISKDQDLASLLEQTMALSRSIVEIEVAGEDGRILLSSNPTRRGTQMRTRTDLRSLRDANPFTRLQAVLDSEADYQSTVPLGIPGQGKPVFTVQVLSSLILLRAAVVPAIQDLAVVSALALIAAIILAWWAASIALRPLKVVGHLIDEISPAPMEPVSGQSELAVIEGKLSKLGERFTRLLGKLDEETRRQVENEIMISRRLVAINSLTGRVAHEIKNPLNSIVLRLEMLRAQVPDAESEISVLSQEIRRLDRVVRTFLDFNRPVEVHMEDIDVRALVSDLVEFVAPEASRAGISVEFVHPPEPLAIRADYDLMRQALLNVAMNAIEAMENGGSLRVDVSQEDGSSVISISDSGPGISAENREKIFQLYFTTKTKGSGIGLAMTFRAIQLQGGNIEWTSEPGQGTTFRISLPLAAVAV